MRLLLQAAVFLSLAVVASGQLPTATATVDSDHDGISDALENNLLTTFEPHFFLSPNDCSALPARFVPGKAEPTVAAEDGTIYGQVSPVAAESKQVELHYYLLWRRDCGEMGHPLDAEHVSALIRQDEASRWKALYWYTAAHEGTVCDASQIARASTVDAVRIGPKVWISYGKHAAFLNRALCARGCGGDTCRPDAPLLSPRIINLGEPGAIVHGANWSTSPAWPLEDKLTRSDFSLSRTQRVDQLPDSDIAWANPELRPMQAVLLGGKDALGGGATGFRATNTALVVANTLSLGALRRASRNTGHALGKTYHGVVHALEPERSSPVDSALPHQP